jgi:hypothetical protein
LRGQVGHGLQRQPEGVHLRVGLHGGDRRQRVAHGGGMGTPCFLVGAFQEGQQRLLEARAQAV